jgi:2-polyprenyl-3-methyl-5-hydroxy-6-metoxy-1,4-benzoquinol methylase
MNNAPTQIADNEGDWKKWNSLWQESEGTENELLFISGQATSRLQFAMQGYFNDLVDLAGGEVSHMKFLELGAGRGTISMYLSQRNCDVTLVDLSEFGLKMAETNFRKAGLSEPTTVVADVRDTGLPSAEYDCVFNIGLLEHFEDPLPVLRESLRLLKPNGLLYSVIVPRIPSYRRWPIQISLNPIVAGLRIIRDFVRPLVLPKRKVHSDMIRTEFSRKQWISWAESLGAIDVRCIPYNCYHQVFRSMRMEELITLPLYKWHQNRKRKKEHSRPAFETLSFIACADLLTFRKKPNP